MTLKIEEDYDILKSILILVIPHKVFCKQLYSVKQGWLFPGFGPMRAAWKTGFFPSSDVTRALIS